MCFAKRRKPGAGRSSLSKAGSDVTATPTTGLKTTAGTDAIRDGTPPVSRLGALMAAAEGQPRHKRQAVADESAKSVRAGSLAEFIADPSSAIAKNATIVENFRLWAAGAANLLSHLERLPYGFCAPLQDSGGVESLSHGMTVAKCATCQALSVHQAISTDASLRMFDSSSSRAGSSMAFPQSTSSVNSTHPANNAPPPTLNPEHGRAGSSDYGATRDHSFQNSFPFTPRSAAGGSEGQRSDRPLPINHDAHCPLRALLQHRYGAVLSAAGVVEAGQTPSPVLLPRHKSPDTARHDRASSGAIQATNANASMTARAGVESEGIHLSAMGTFSSETPPWQRLGFASLESVPRASVPNAGRGTDAGVSAFEGRKTSLRPTRGSTASRPDRAAAAPLAGLQGTPAAHAGAVSAVDRRCPPPPPGLTTIESLRPAVSSLGGIEFSRNHLSSLAPLSRSSSHAHIGSDTGNTSPTPADAKGPAKGGRSAQAARGKR